MPIYPCLRAIMRPIRTAARALIILNQQLLAIKMRDASGVFYILPGGGQRHGETLQEGLVRECREEIGTTVEVGELLYVREYIGKNHEFRNAQVHSTKWKASFAAACRIRMRSGRAPSTTRNKSAWLGCPSTRSRNIASYPRSSNLSSIVMISNPRPAIWGMPIKQGSRVSVRRKGYMPLIP